MKMKKSQKEKCLEVLKLNRGRWLPAHHFVGERRGINGFVFLSYKAPARLSEIYKEVDGIEREKTIGRTGAKYYQYRLTA